MHAARSLAIGLTLVMVASGCTSEPSLKEAATELQKDAQRLETDDLFKNPLMKLRILQRPDKNIPCREDGFKRVLRATASKEREKEQPLDSYLDGAERVMKNTLSQILGYKVDYDITQLDAPEGRFIQANKKIGITMNVYVSPEAPTWRIYAQTNCLPQ